MADIRQELLDQMNEFLRVAKGGVENAPAELLESVLQDSWDGDVKMMAVSSVITLMMATLEKKHGYDPFVVCEVMQDQAYKSVDASILHHQGGPDAQG